MHLTRDQLSTELEFRTGNSITGITARWSSADFIEAIKQAIGMCEPCGREMMFTFTAAGYTANPQTVHPSTVAADVIFIKRVIVVNSSGIPTVLPRELYELDRASGQWFLLHKAPVTGETMSVWVIQAIPNPAAGSDEVGIDSELVLAYAMHVLYTRWVDQGGANSRQDDMVRAERWFTVAQARKQELFALQYGDTQQPPGRS